MPGAIISSVDNMAQLHRRYSIVRQSDFLGSMGIQMTGLFVLAGYETSDDSGISIAANDRIHPSKRATLQILDGARLGIDDAGIVIRDDAKQNIILSGGVYRSTGSLRLARFGLVKSPLEMGYITFFEHQIRGMSPMMLSASDCRVGMNPFSHQIVQLSIALHKSGAWETGIVPATKRLVRWAGHRTLRSIGIKLGD